MVPSSCPQRPPTPHLTFTPALLISVAAIAGATAACFLLVPTLGSELFPDVDAGSFEVRLKTIPGSKLERTEEVVIALEDSIKQTIGEEHIETIIANIGLPVGKGAGFSTILSPNLGDQAI